MRSWIPKDSVLTFATFVYQRESLRLRKQLGLTPWTTDPILAKYRFCNIRRRDDRVSRWVWSRVAMGPVPDGSMGLFHLGMFLALCRWVNWPPTIAVLLHQKCWPSARPNWVRMGRLIDGCKKLGVKTWTGAYMVRAERAIDHHDFSAWGKGSYVTKIVIQREMNLAAHNLRLALRTKKRQAVHAVLMRCYGWGSFMAGQVVDDWSWTPLLQDATDHLTWAPLGPGSTRGLNRLLGFSPTQPEAVLAMIELRNAILTGAGPEYKDLTLMDIQNCLCEYDKYERARLGQGRPKSLYKPETAY